MALRNMSFEPHPQASLAPPPPQCRVLPLCPKLRALYLHFNDWTGSIHMPQASGEALCKGLARLPQLQVGAHSALRVGTPAVAGSQIWQPRVYTLQALQSRISQSLHAPT